jgi:Uma2 family endonuclease
MVSPLSSTQSSAITYPDSDGKPMADNTKQFRWILVIQQNLDWIFAQDPNVFVAGDLLWYPTAGNNKLRQAPDIMIVFGRPKGDRGSYQQWKEDNITPQVVFEILSPGNTQTEMNRKLVFYERYGVEEYYIYDPDKYDLSGWLRSESRLDLIEEMHNWVSPRCGIRFDCSGDELEIYRPDGQKFFSYLEIGQFLEQERQRAEQERQRAEQAEQQVADMETLLQQYRERFGELPPSE